jgi:dynein light intermediate chain
MTLDAYRALYDASVSFGVRKQLQAEEGLPQLAAQLSELAEKKAVTEVRVLALKSKVRAGCCRSRARIIAAYSPQPRAHMHAQCTQLSPPPAAQLDLSERRFAEKRALDEKRRTEELAYLRHQQKHMEAFLKNMPR